MPSLRSSSTIRRSISAKRASSAATRDANTSSLKRIVESIARRSSRQAGLEPVEVGPSGGGRAIVDGGEAVLEVGERGSVATLERVEIGAVLVFQPLQVAGERPVQAVDVGPKAVVDLGDVVVHVVLQPAEEVVDPVDDTREEIGGTHSEHDRDQPEHRTDGGAPTGTGVVVTVGAAATR